MIHADGAARSLLRLLLLPGPALLAVSGCAAQKVPEDATAGKNAADVSAGDAAPSQNVVAFVGVHVVPLDVERVLERQTVLVEGTRIARIGPADRVVVPEGAVRIEGEGRWLIPGLGEMHAHVPPQGDNTREETWAAAERVLFLYLANGITTARGMLGDPLHLKLREALQKGEVLGPRLYTSGPSLNGNSIPDPDSARRAVRHQAAAGYDFLKIHPGLSRAAYDAIAETADSAGIRWAGHVPAAVGLERALAAQQASVDHLDGYTQAILAEGTDPPGSALFFGVNLVELADPSKIPQLAVRTREAGVWNVPTQSLIEHVLSPEWTPEEMAEWPEMRYMPPSIVQTWVNRKRNFLQNAAYTPERARAFIDLRRRIIGGLHEAGAKLLLGSDAPQIFQVPGFSIHAELRMMVASGLSEYEALVAGTRNIAEYFGALEDFGTIEEGKVADLVLLEADPLEDIGNVARRAGVMVRGRWLPMSEIEGRLAAIAAEASE